MKYYAVHLPLSIAKELVYTYSEPVKSGSRVIVPLGSKHILGICGNQVAVEDFSITYKMILEVLDEEPIISSDLLSLATWMASYYQCSLGIALFAMLPSRLQPDIDATVSWIDPEDKAPAELVPLKKGIIEKKANSLKELRNLLPSYPVFSRVEEAERKGFLQVVRKITHKDKPKTQNFIHKTNEQIDIGSLTLKQHEAWILINEKPQVFPLSEVSSQITYSIVKSLIKKGIIEIKPHIVETPKWLRGEHSKPKQITLNDEQLKAIEEILQSYGRYSVHLLYGITGSGKTEVYLEIIRKYIADGKGVIFLIPEIALTPQMVDRFDSSFGDILAIQHSQLTESQRFDQWQRLKSGECKIVIGARSAIFAPIVNLGLIIVDEEHEQSYKQDSNPRYHGRDLAVVRANLQKVQIVLGSATPSLESWKNALDGKYSLHKLTKRPLSYKLPEVQVIDMCETYSKELLSDKLIGAIADRLEKKEQVILFHNRRGYSSFMQCMKCGKLISCPNCEISMYYHRDREEMQCHYCGNFFPSPRKCPSCGGYSFSYGAPGTQKVEQILHLLFPEARVLRLDSDSSRSHYSTMYQRMKNREVDILLGTQMISKGLDFPHVTLVGIIMADISLNFPDFRAAERTFQLLTQVAGRSGRAEKSGEVIIQTFNPEHYAIVNASKQDFESFVAEELMYRKRLFYPPRYRLLRILFQSTDNQLLKTEMRRLTDFCTQLQSSELLILGPSPAPYQKINSLYRYHILVKGFNSRVLKEAIAVLYTDFTESKGISKLIDVDPIILM